MKLGIMQPYFMPYIGYWQLMAAVDTYVVYDDVNYIKGGWVSRNNILMNGLAHMFTITLNGASPNKHFNKIEVRDDFKKFRNMLQSCYAKAPYYKEIMPVLEQVFAYENRNLGMFLYHSYQVILDYLGIDTELILSSTIEKDNSLRAGEKVKHICHLLGADTYYNAIGGQELYDKADFKDAGIELRFLQTNAFTYPQQCEPFVPNLSIIDVLMHNGKEGTQRLLKEYTLI